MSRTESGLTPPTYVRDLVEPLMRGWWEPRWDWLRQGDKEAVPFLSSPPMETELAVRLAAGAHAAGYGRLVAGCTRASHFDERVTELSVGATPISERLAEWDTDFVVAPPDLTAALVVTTRGYAFAAGPPVFVLRLVGGDIDAAKRAFWIRASNAPDREQHLLTVAMDFGCGPGGRGTPAWRAWTTRADVPPTSHVAAELALMRDLVAGRLPASEFERSWLDARSHEIATGERVSGLLGDALHHTMVAVDEFVSDPELRDPNDPDELDENELIDAVRTALSWLDSTTT